MQIWLFFRNDRDILATLSRRGQAPVSADQGLTLSQQSGCVLYLETSAKISPRSALSVFEVAALAKFGNLGSRGQAANVVNGAGMMSEYPQPPVNNMSMSMMSLSGVQNQPPPYHNPPPPLPMPLAMTTSSIHVNQSNVQFFRENPYYCNSKAPPPPVPPKPTLQNTIPTIAPERSQNFPRRAVSTIALNSPPNTPGLPAFPGNSSQREPVLSSHRMVFDKENYYNTTGSKSSSNGGGSTRSRYKMAASQHNLYDNNKPISATHRPVSASRPQLYR